MILHPGILALLGGGLLVAALLAAGAVLAGRILAGWDPQSSSERQLELERRTLLVASLVKAALVFEAGSALLFVLTAEAIHPLFTGAMCATGTLNAHPAGWAALGLKLAMLLAASVWLALHALDARTPDLALTRPKFLALFLLAPLAVAEWAAMAAFFAGLEPQRITSCCGSLFGADIGVASGLSALPAAVMGPALGGLVALYAATFWASDRWSGGWRLVHGGTGLLLGNLALPAVLSFLAPLVYALPTHHCPFDMLQGHYRFIGYPLYTGLFGAILTALLPALFWPFKSRATVAVVYEEVMRRWTRRGAVCMAVFATAAAWPVFGNMQLWPHLP